MALVTGKKDEIKRLEELVEALRSEISVLVRQLDLQQDQLSIKDRQIEQLHVLIRQAQAALPPPRETRPWWRVWGQRSAQPASPVT